MEKNPAFRFTEADLVKSVRYYLLKHPVRVADDNQIVKLPLPQLYPSMQADTLQKGVRIGDLYDEEKLPCFPCIGVHCDGLVRQRTGVGGYREYFYPFFLDAVCKVEDANGAVDRVATYNQRLSLLSDLRTLLVEGQGRAIPFYTFNSDKTRTEVGTVTVERSPDIRLRNNPLRGGSLLGLNGEFMVKIILADA